MTALEVRELASGYGKARVLHGVSFEVGSDQVRAILGPNGSGKSTLLKTIVGLVRCFEGSISWDDQDVTRRPVHERAAAGFGYVPQNDNVFANLTVDENLWMGAFLLPRREIQAERARILELFPHLAQRLAVPGRGLSGGERRLLSLAMTLIARPRLLLLDEPTSDLAPSAIDTVFDRIAAARVEYRVPIVLVEQNVPRALAIADQVAVLQAGRCKLDKPPNELAEGELEELFLG